MLQNVYATSMQHERVRTLTLRKTGSIRTGSYPLVEVDEWANETHDCDTDATCTDQFRGYSCPGEYCIADCNLFDILND